MTVPTVLTISNMNKKRRMIWLLCLIMCWLTGWAQNSVESIRERYAQQKAYIDSQNGSNQYDGADWAEYYHLVTRQFLPATGGHQEDLYLYWSKEEASGEEEEPAIYPSHYLTFATKKYNFAAREFYEEYLYDKDGKPAFIYGYQAMWISDASQAFEPYEFRFYLNQGKLIKVLIKKQTDDKAAFTEVYSGAGLRKEYEETFNTYMSSAKAISELFLNIEKETYNY